MEPRINVVFPGWQCKNVPAKIDGVPDELGGESKESVDLKVRKIFHAGGRR